MRLPKSKPFGGLPRAARPGFGQERLPHRTALTTLTRGNPTDRSFGNYAKKTPGVGDPTASFVQMSKYYGK